MAEKLAFTSFGNGKAVVLIHGWGLNSGVWQPLIESLSVNHKIITIDLPGYGINKSILPEHYTLDDIAELIQHSIDEPAVYLGWSLGGLIATKIALQHPEKVTRLITVCSSPCFVEQAHWHGIAPDVLALFHRQLSTDTVKTIDGFLKIQAMGSPHIRQDIKLIRELIMQFPMADKETLNKSLCLLETSDLRQELPRLSMPVLRMYGRLDSLVPKKALNDIDELMPTSDSVVFENSSHAPFISHLEEFSENLAMWLS